MHVPAFSFTSNATTYTLTGGPADVTPGSTREFTGPTIDNGAAPAMAAIRMGATGTITLYKDLSTSSFTNSGTKGNSTFPATYLLA